MTKSTHHSFDIELASEYGVTEAIIIHHMQHWVNHNKSLGRNFKDGRTWTYQTRKEIAAWFPYLSEKQVRTITDKLVRVGVLRKGNYNKSSIDKTIWYAFEDEIMFTTAQMGNGAAQMGNGAAHLGKPIPDTIPDAELHEDTTTREESSSSLIPQNEEEDRVKLYLEMRTAGINDRTIKNTSKYSCEQIATALYNLSLKKDPDNASGYFFDQLKNGYGRKETAETKEEDERRKRADLLKEADARRKYVQKIQGIGEGIEAMDVKAFDTTFEIVKEGNRTVCGYLERGFSIVFPGYFKEKMA